MPNQGLRSYAASQRGMFLQVGKVGEFEGGFVGGFQDDLGGAAGVEGFLPAGGAEAPAVSGFQAGEAVFRLGRGEVVAAAFGEFEETVGHPGTDDMDAGIALAGAAAAIAEPAGEGFDRAGLEGRSEHVERFAGHDDSLTAIGAASSVLAVVRSGCHTCSRGNPMGQRPAGTLRPDDREGAAPEPAARQLRLPVPGHPVAGGGGRVPDRAWRRIQRVCRHVAPGDAGEIRVVLVRGFHHLHGDHATGRPDPDGAGAGGGEP